MTDTLHALDRAGSSLVSWVLEMNLWGAIVLVAAAICDRSLSRRVAPAWRVLLYCAVLARVALPLNAWSPVGVLPPIRLTQQSNTGVFRIGDALPPDPQSVALAASGPVSSEQPVALTSGGVLSVLVYAAGAFAIVLVRARSSRRLRVLRRECRPVGEAGTGSPTGPELLEHPTQGPLLVGLFRPALILPASLLAPERSRDLDWVLRHERAHAARRDPVLALFLQIVCAAFWPIAAVWIASVRIRSLMEQACDDAALRGTSVDDRSDYARTLLALSVRSPRLLRPVLAASLPFGADVRSRIAAIVPRPRWRTGVQSVLCLALMLGFVACAADRGGQGSQAGEARLSGAELTPFKGSKAVEITVLRGWPNHPKLNFQIAQTSTALNDPAHDPKAGADDRSKFYRILTPEEFREVLAAAVAEKPDAVIARPRLELILGLPASIRAGNDDAKGNPIDGIQADVTITTIFQEAGSAVWQYGLDATFERFGDENKIASSTRIQRVAVPAGHTLAALATGLKGAEMALVCFTPMPGGVRSVDVAPAPEKAEDKWPKIEMRVALDTASSATAIERILRDVGGRRVDLPASVAAGAKGATVYTLPEERLADLYKRAAGDGANGFVKGGTPEILALPGQDASISWESAPIPGGAAHPASREVTLRGVLATPADRPGTIQGGSLALAATVSLPQTHTLVTIPPTTVQNYNASGHFLALVVVMGADLTGDGRAAIVSVTGRRYGSVEEIPTQVFILPNGNDPMR